MITESGQSLCKRYQVTAFNLAGSATTRARIIVRRQNDQIFAKIILTYPKIWSFCAFDRPEVLPTFPAQTANYNIQKRQAPLPSE